MCLDGQHQSSCSVRFDPHIQQLSELTKKYKNDLLKCNHELEVPLCKILPEHSQHAIKVRIISLPVGSCQMNTRLAITKLIVTSRICAVHSYNSSLLGYDY